MPDTLTVPLAPAYREILAPPLGAYRYRVAFGGRGSAKSWQFARALLLRSREQRLRVLCAREIQGSIRDSVHKLLGDQIEELGMGAEYEVQTATIKHVVTGSEYIFKGLRHNAREIKSTEGVDVCWVEEAEAVSDDSWGILIPTIRKTDSEIWVTFNPLDPTAPTDVRFRKQTPPRAIVRKYSWRDNPWLPEVLKEEAEHLRRVDPDRYAHVWEGEYWQRSDAQVLADKWTVEDFTPAESWNGPYYGADWGFSQDPTALVRFWIADGRLWIEYEAGGVGVDLGKDTADLWDTVPGSRKHRIRADNARPESVSAMAGQGFDVISAPKWSGSVEDGVAWLRSHEQIVIHPRCRRTAEEARLWSYKTDRLTGDPLPKLADGWDHYWDAIRYGASPMIQKAPEPSFRSL